jgi:hypothetical protein
MGRQVRPFPRPAARHGLGNRGNRSGEVLPADFAISRGPAHDRGAGGWDAGGWDAGGWDAGGWDTGGWDAGGFGAGFAAPPSIFLMNLNKSLSVVRTSVVSFPSTTL